jgi:hypothetical protein
MPLQVGSLPDQLPSALQVRVGASRVAKPASHTYVAVAGKRPPLVSWMLAVSGLLSVAQTTPWHVGATPDQLPSGRQSRDVGSVVEKPSLHV